jgi:hypothetical protein
MRKRWTIEERMTLHHLFALIGYRANDTDWFRIYQQLHDTARGETTIYEDWRFGGLKDRGLMWEHEIRLEVSQCSDAQRTAFYTSRANIDATVSRLNITIPNNIVPHNAQTVNAPTLLAAPVATTLLPAALSTNNHPTAATTSRNAIAPGSSTSNTQQVQTGEAASDSKKQKAAVDVAASQPSPAAETPANEPRRESITVGKRKQAVTFDTNSDAADGLFSISDVFKKGRGKHQTRDDRETQDAAIASELAKGYGDTKAGTANERVRKVDDKKGAEKNSSARKVYQEPDDSVGYIHNLVKESDPTAMTDDEDAGEGKSPEDNQQRDQAFDGDEEWTI